MKLASRTSRRGSVDPVGRGRPGLSALIAGLGLLALSPAPGAGAQEMTLPTVGDSPTALALCRRAEDLRDGNPAEAARIVHRILDEFADRLVATDGEEERFVAAWQRASELLRASPRVREEWRRIVAPTIERLLDEGDDEALVRIAALAPEGAEAALRLAQRRLEAGRPAAALGMLDRFDPEVLADERARRFAALMRTTALSLVRPDGDPVEAFLPLDGEVHGWPRIWRLPLPNAPYARRYLNPVTGPLVTVPTAPQAIEDGSLLTVMPLVADDRVFLSEGHVVSAIDRLSRRLRWQRSLASGEDVEVAPIADASELALAGDTLIVLTGHGSATRRTGGGRIVALDAETGRVKWERSLSGLEPPDPDGAEGLFPHGAPVVVDDLVIVMARKVNSRLESVASVIALSLRTGEPRWSTYIAGAGSRPMSGMRALSSPSAEQGALFVATGVGAVARIDPETGAIRWLIRALVPTADGLASPVPWETSAPVLTAAGLLAISPDQSLLLAIDPASGEVRRRIPLGRGEAWGNPRYLVADREGSRVLAVGDDAILFRADDLDRPIWRLGAALSASGESLAQLPIRGRVSFADERIAGRLAACVPLPDRVLIVDASHGAILQRLDTGRPGNPLLAQGQVMVAAADRLECFMPLLAAERAVRDWMSRDPDDATRAMALLELGVQCSVPAMIFEGARTAGAALDRADDPAVRTELVRRILAGAITETTLPDPEVRGLLELALHLAREDADRVACALSEGDWSLANGRPEEAVGAWQRVLSDPNLRRAQMGSPEGSMLASSQALSRIAALLAASGAGSSAARERQAEAALRALGPSAPPGQLAELAEAWAGSAAAAAAAIRAAEGFVASGSPRQAFLILASATRDRSRFAGADASTRQLVSALVSVARAVGWSDAAALELVSLLDRITVAQGASQEAVTMVRNSLRAVKARDPAVRDLPDIGVRPSSAIQVRGRLASLSPQAELERPTDLALLVERGERPGVRNILSLRRGPELERLWQQPIDADDPEVIAFGETILLWQRGSGADASMLALSASDGSRRWAIPSISELFDPSRAVAAPVPSRRAFREGAFLSPSEMVPFRADPWVIVARRNGDLLCVDSRDGSMRWRRDGMVPDLISELGPRSSQVAATSMLVAVGGSRRNSSGAALPFVTLVDPDRGDLVGTVDLPAVGDVDWVTITPGPLVLAAVRNTVFAIRPGRAQPEWTRVDHRLAGGAPVLVANDHLLLLAQRPGSRRDEIVALDLLEGRVEPDRFPLPSRRSFGVSRLVSLQRLPDGIVAGFNDRVVIYDATGRLRGQDAVASEHSYAQVLPARETLVVVDPDSNRSFFTNPDRTGSAQPAAVLYQLLRREGGRLASEPMAVPVGDQTAHRWILLEGAVVGSGLDWCTAIPMPAEAPR